MPRWEFRLIIGLLAAGLMGLAFPGCESRRPASFSRPEDLERFATLALADASHDADLRAELARIATEGGTPAQLAPQLKPDGAVADPVTPATTVAELTEIFPPDTCQALAPRLRAVYPNDRFQFAPLLRGTAREILHSAEPRRANYERWLLTGERPRIYPHASGIGADASYLQAIEVGNRLMGLSVAEQLAADQLPQAVATVDAMLRGSEWLVVEKHPLPRLAGAHRRREALIALGAIARHPRATAQVHAALHELVARQFANWPRDAEAWIGERAEGLHTYELVRAGYLLSLLPFDNLRKWRDEIGIKRLGELVAENLDADQQFYLSTMRQIIAACDRPYHERRELLRQIEEHRERLRSSDYYPFVADQLLLNDLAARQELVALDQARCLAWQIALTLATGGPKPGAVINPVTGEPFSVSRIGGTITVDAIGPAEPAIELTRSAG